MKTLTKKTTRGKNRPGPYRSAAPKAQGIGAQIRGSSGAQMVGYFANYPSLDGGKGKPGRKNRGR